MWDKDISNSICEFYNRDQFGIFFQRDILTLFHIQWRDFIFNLWILQSISLWNFGTRNLNFNSYCKTKIIHTQFFFFILFVDFTRNMNFDFCLYCSFIPPKYEFYFILIVNRDDIYTQFITRNNNLYFHKKYQNVKSLSIEMTHIQFVNIYKTY